jgi:hypothetical protein
MRTWSAEDLEVAEKHRLLRARGILVCINGRTIADIVGATICGYKLSLLLVNIQL